MLPARRGIRWRRSHPWQEGQGWRRCDPTGLFLTILQSPSSKGQSAGQSRFVTLGTPLQPRAWGLLVRWGLGATSGYDTSSTWPASSAPPRSSATGSRRAGRRPHWRGGLPQPKQVATTSYNLPRLPPGPSHGRSAAASKASPRCSRTRVVPLADGQDQGLDIRSRRRG